MKEALSMYWVGGDMKKQGLVLTGLRYDTNRKASIL